MPARAPLPDEFRALVNRCIDGDQSAMLDLVARHQAQVFGLCYRMLGNRQDAEDASQETFLRVLKNLGKWDQDRAFEPWLLTIAGNRCRTALAKRARRPSSQTLVQAVPDPRPDFQAADHLSEEVDLALQQLRPDYRQAFVLFHQHELSYEEIATALSRPIGTIKTWIHRARAELIQCLKDRAVLEEAKYAVRRV